jgi:hypothetical protein
MQIIRQDWHAIAQAVERSRRHKGEPVRKAVPSYVRETVFRNGWGFRVVGGVVSKVLEDIGED